MGLTKLKKVVKDSLSLVMPRILKNIYLSICYRCIIHPLADIRFIKNLKIGKGTIIGKCEIICQNNITLGKNCFLNDYCILNSKTGKIEIGKNTNINHFCVIFGDGGVKIGESCSIAPNVQILNNHIIPTKKNQPYKQITTKYTEIGNFNWICANVVIVDGIKTSDNVIVGANSFVNKNLNTPGVYAGCPIRLIRKR